MAATAPTPHHHRSTTKSLNKPFKTRHATKSALKTQAKGKVEVWDKGSRKTPHQQIMSKLDRRNQAKQRRLNHHAKKEEEVSVFAGRDGAPRIVAIIPLCEDIIQENIVKQLNCSVDVEDTVLRRGGWRGEIPRFRQKVQYLTPARDLMQCLDACRVADFVLFALSAYQEVDEIGEQMLRCIESQGVSTVLTGVQGLDKIESAKKRSDVLRSLKSFITHFFASQEKIHDFGSRQECSNILRSLCTLMPKGIRWREARSWMLVDDCRVDGAKAVVTGVVRGQGLKADRLVQVGEWGDMQIEKITAASFDERESRTRPDAMAIDDDNSEQVFERATDDQDDLIELAPEEIAMDDVQVASIAPSMRKAVLLDDHHYFHKDDEAGLSETKRLPRGTSKYQAAWYLGEVSDSGSDLEDIDEDDEMADAQLELHRLVPADVQFDDNMQEATEYGGPSEYPQSEIFLDPAPEEEAEQLEAYRKQRHDEAKQDLDFPDEIELPPNVLAKERLARYRGLKNLRTSKWETEEDKPFEPLEWGRLLDIADYKSAKNRVLKEARKGGVKPGTRVAIYLRASAERLQELHALPRPKFVFSLLKHEHKQTAINVSISLPADHPAPVKSKTEMVLQCGPRRLLINPLFSELGNTPNNVHKFDRFLHPGRTAVATFIGPMTWGSVPCLFFKSNTQTDASDPVEGLAQSLTKNTSINCLQMIGTGTVLAPSTGRVIAKRINLTGHPYKIHKKLVTVRYMFFNAEDVAYFRALQLWTKRGRSGFIKEALGTHGYFKATFDGRINPLDAVAVSLYKRVWPRKAITWSAEETVQQADADSAAVIELA